ncbi:bacteriophage holin [Natronobacterium texcoconense]|uniref:Uncharacterized protein n=1 Tax=Natronobacterium texcoconense TaxID=1095778 RepID=A0A1H1GR44_NATTX|nr:bacteriophage holin [Natronobacterium texcoconense]SDR15553.1 hypothetical protein SAMN04489842_2554 [Natronobacterium texcoconense]
MSTVDKRALGLSAGILWAAAVALLELFAGTKYGERWRLLLEDIYPGYSRSPGDLVWGTVLGFADAFAFGYLFGWLYNRLARNPDATRQEEGRVFSERVTNLYR